MEILDILIEKVEILFVLIILGLIVKKIGFFKKEFTVELGNVLLKIVTPVTIFNSFMNERTIERTKQMFLALILYTLIEIVAIIFAGLFFKDKKYGIENFAIVVSNIGFFGLPLIYSVLGKDSVIFGAAVVAVNSTLMWTYGVYILSRDKNAISLKTIIKTPTVIATILGLICYLLNIRIPVIIQNSFASLSNVSSPLCSLIIGATLAETEFSELKDDISNFFVVVIRQVVIPLVVAVIFKFIDNSFNLVKYSLLILTCVPNASSTSIFAYQYGYDADKAARLTCACSLVCVLTMPLITNFAISIW